MNLKKLLEQKNTLCDKVNELCLAAENEERALNAEEIEKINGKLAEIRSIEESIKIEEERRAIEFGKGKKGEKEQLADKEKFEIEKRAFDELIRKDVLQYHEERADVNMTTVRLFRPVSQIKSLKLSKMSARFFNWPPFILSAVLCRSLFTTKVTVKFSVRTRMNLMNWNRLPVNLLT